MAETTVKSTTKKAATKTAVTSAKPVAKKPTARKTAEAAPVQEEKKPVAAKKAPAKKSDTGTKPAVKKPAKGMKVSDEQRYRMVAEAAYYRAESNQFKSDPLRDWIEAEKDIAALLNGNS